MCAFMCVCVCVCSMCVCVYVVCVCVCLCMHDFLQVCIFSNSLRRGLLGALITFVARDELVT